MPKIKVDEVFKTLEGKPLKQSEDGTEKEIKVLDMVLQVILVESGEDKPSQEEKLKRYRLAQKISASQNDADVTELSLTTEEASLIKRIAGKTTLSPLIYGQIDDLLDA